jgi:uncharacterized protein YegP (UPF0339 family)
VKGIFELVEPSHGAFEFRLISHTGKVLAVSGTYSDKDSAVAAIRIARESAAMALIQDHTTRTPQPPTPSTTKPRHDHGAPSQWFG